MLVLEMIHHLTLLQLEKMEDILNYLEKSQGMLVMPLDNSNKYLSLKGQKLRSNLRDY